MARAENWLYTIVYGGPVWLRDLFRRKQSEEQLDEELSFHLERQIQEDVAHGMDPAEARQRALREWKAVNRVKQECRDVRRINPIEDLTKDAVHAARTLRKAPIFAVTAVITIALGIGLSSAIFSVTHAVLLRRLPYPDPDRLVMALRDMPKRGVLDYPMSAPDFVDVRNESKTVFEDLAAVAVASRDTVILARDGTPEQVHIQSATANLLPLLGAKTILGRGFGDGQAESGGAIISYDYWQHRYAGDESVVGRPIPEIGAAIVGVLEPGFEMLLPPRLALKSSPDIWIPWRLTYTNTGRNAGQLRMLGRLKPGVSVAQAQGALDGIAGEFERKFAVKATSGFAIRLEPMRHYLVSEVQPTILALSGAVMFLLLIACANVANLLLVRTSLREREFAMRASLGGTTLRLMRQLIAESLVLVGMGAALGIGLAYAGIWELHRMAPANPGLANLPRFNTIGLDSAVAGFAIVVAIAAAASLGIVTACRAVRPDVIRVLRSNGPAGPSGASGTTFRNCIVAAEIGLSFVLLIGAGLMFRSFLALQHVGLGYDSRGVLIFRVTGAQRSATGRAAFVTELQDRLQTLPNVQAVTSSSALPLAGGFQVIRWGKQDEQADAIAGAADYQSVRPGYFEALRTPLLDGRTFTEEDNSPDHRVVIVDDLLAAREFPLESAVGKRLVVSLPGQGPQAYEVIGVVAHQRDTSLAEAGREQIYATDGLAGYPISGYWVVRTAQDHAACAKAIRAELAKLDSGVTVTEMQPMTAFVERAESSTRFSVILIGAFAAIAALLAGVGLYGVLATMVRQRAAEIGIRIAMGATPWSIFRLVVSRGMLLSAAGLIAGVLASLVLTRAMTSMLVEVKPADPITFAAMAALFLAIAVVASWLPARRASSMDPGRALKE
jgi:predicted permease